MSKFSDLENELLKGRPKLLSAYNEGLSEIEIKEKLNAFSLTATSETIDLFKWINGVKDENVPSGATAIFCFGVLYDLDTLGQNYVADLELNLIARSLFPIALDESMYVNLNASSSNYGMVYIRAPQLLVVTPETIFDSVENLCMSHIEAYRRSYIQVDAEGLLDINWKKFSNLARQLNPNSTHWKSY